MPGTDPGAPQLPLAVRPRRPQRTIGWLLGPRRLRCLRCWSSWSRTNLSTRCAPRCRRCSPSVRNLGYADNFFAITHPGLPNYIVMSSGDQHGVNDDAPPSTGRCPARASSVGTGSGHTARAYLDAMPSNCQLTDEDTYAVRHNPWTYFVDERSQCAVYDKPLDAALTADV